MDDLNHQVKKMVAQCLYLDVTPESLSDSDDLLKVFDLDPAMLTGITLGLENQFGITVSEKEFNVEQFSRVSGIVSFVQAKRAAWEQQRAEAIAEIRMAFENVQRGNGVSLREADVIDGYGTQEERKEARAKDTENSWQGVPHEDIEHFSWVFPFLDPVGFRYYIPAYMIWCLHHDSDSVDATICALKAHENVKHKTKESARIEIFNTEQSKAIAMFLACMIQCDRCDQRVAKRTFDKYWSKFLKPEGEPGRKPKAKE